MRVAARTTAILIAALASAARGQNTFPSSGNVGIGTTSPGAPLDIIANSTATVPQFRVRPIGWSASTTSMPSVIDFFATFDNFPSDQSPRRTAAIRTQYTRPNPSTPGVWGSETLVFEVGTPDQGTSEPIERMRIAGNGTVGIGTATPSSSYRLDVAGAIGATDIFVTSNALPDYVFDADYRNAPLPEVAKYIAENHHLPGIPSAAEAEKSRLNVGDMQNKLLQKVEELTLHMIAADERNTRLEEQNRDLQAQVAQLRAQIQAKPQAGH